MRCFLTNSDLWRSLHSAWSMQSIRCMCVLRCTRNGHYAGSACNRCADEFQSDNCSAVCPMVNGSACNSRGRCCNGKCVECWSLASDQQKKICGTGCHLSGSVCQAHNTCPLGYYSANCSVVCPSYSAGRVCSGHGTCHQVTGLCVCDAPYGGDECRLKCPLVNGLACGFHGVCTPRGTCFREAPFSALVCCPAVMFAVGMGRAMPSVCAPASSTTPAWIVAIRARLSEVSFVGAMAHVQNMAMHLYLRASGRVLHW